MTSTSRNITFDDAFNATSFIYQPANCTGSGWGVTEDRGYLGTYRSCTTSLGPSANVTFTGVAVFYKSAFIEGNSIRFKLDGVLSDNVDLSTPRGQAINKTATKVFWQAANLTNGIHTLQLLPGNGSSTLDVDAIIVTQVDSVNATTSIPIASAVAAAQGAAGTSSNTKFSYALGITFGSISFIIFLAILVFLGRRRRELNKRFSWARPIPPLRPPSTGLFSQGGHTGTQDQYISPVNSPKMGEAPLPMRPLANISQTSGSSPMYEVDEAYDDFDTGASRPWASPASSNRVLLSPASLSSRDRLDNTPALSRSGTATSSSTTRLEPVRRVTIL